MASITKDLTGAPKLRFRPIICCYTSAAFQNCLPPDRLLFRWKIFDSLIPGMRELHCLCPFTTCGRRGGRHSAIDPILGIPGCCMYSPLLLTGGGRGASWSHGLTLSIRRELLGRRRGGPPGQPFLGSCTGTKGKRFSAWCTRICRVLYLRVQYC